MLLMEKTILGRHSLPGNARQGFTLVEIMIVVAIIGLLAALAVPGVVRNRQRSQGERTVNDARIIDAAINSWALETGQTDGNAINLTGAASYTKTGVIPTNEVLGNPYTITTVGLTQVLISATTKTALANVGIDWGPY